MTCRVVCEVVMFSGLIRNLKKISFVWERVFSEDFFFEKVVMCQNGHTVDYANFKIFHYEGKLYVTLKCLEILM